VPLREPASRSKKPSPAARSVACARETPAPRRTKCASRSRPRRISPAEAHTSRRPPGSRKATAPPASRRASSSLAQPPVFPLVLGVALGVAQRLDGAVSVAGGERLLISGEGVAHPIDLPPAEPLARQRLLHLLEQPAALVSARRALVVADELEGRAGLAVLAALLEERRRLAHRGVVARGRRPLRPRPAKAAATRGPAPASRAPPSPDRPSATRPSARRSPAPIPAALGPEQMHLGDLLPLPAQRIVPRRLAVIAGSFCRHRAPVIAG
jgi:hypothetical protein